MVCIGLLFIFMLYVRNSNEKLERLMEQEKEIKEIQKKYYEMLLEREEMTRNYRHDMNGFLLGLLAVSEDDGPRTKKYIQDLQKIIESPQRYNFVTGNEVLNALLCYYIPRLEEGVAVTVTGMCSENILISDIDICFISK